MYETSVYNKSQLLFSILDIHRLYRNFQGDRLKEAGSINNSLMTLRRCIDGLRNNQRNGAKG